jgi:hypothetical protein
VYVADSDNPLHASDRLLTLASGEGSGKQDPDASSSGNHENRLSPEVSADAAGVYGEAFGLVGFRQDALFVFSRETNLLPPFTVFACAFRH